jgi:Icc-related predicted phosphoesterase
MTTKKLKILAAGDFHGDTNAIRDLAKKAKKEDVDYVILTGDFTFAEQSLKNIIGPFAKQNKKVLIIPGNHETTATTKFLEAKYDHAIDLHDRYILKDHVGIFGTGSANIGIFQLSERELFETLKKNWKKVSKLEKQIMVTHVHPSGGLIETFTDFFPGSTGVRKAIDKFQPTIALCSHVHEAHGIEEKIGRTKVINVGKKGRIIEI